MSPASRRSVLCVVGTRPEAIKMAPVIRALGRAAWADARVLVSGQHADVPQPILKFFGIEQFDELPPQIEGTSRADALANLTVAMRAYLALRRPDVVLVQGDTTTVAAAALAATSEAIPLGHVEAGLRTDDLQSPFPEELYRRLTTRLARWHFAPTPAAAYNLLFEDVAADAVAMVGNPVIDALREAVARRMPLPVSLDPRKRMVLVTAHRRETLGEPLENVCRAVADLTAGRNDVEVLWPLPPNPAAAAVVRGLLADAKNVHLCAPLPYAQFASALAHAHFILTDSGGIQEEAPSLGKPVLVLRTVTERPEAVECGAARLIGTEQERIVLESRRLLDDAAWHRSMSCAANPFGDGRAAERIVEALARSLDITRETTSRAMLAQSA